jgi:hypothetical protein
MDSGLNHLDDISLDPRYAGLCGFTVDEFPALFADRMAPTLQRLKENGRIFSSADVQVLWAQIKEWYDGYNWGGETRVLNPYSILHFFDKSHFSEYWIRSGRPGHLTALIKANPEDYINPELESQMEEEVKKSELTKLKALPVLFHSGYLTVDKIVPVAKKDDKNGIIKIVDSYSFRFPNYEVSSSYKTDICQVIFDKKRKTLETRGKEIQMAFLARDAKTIETIFGNYLSTISYFERIKDEKTFHAFIHLILKAMGFKVRSELSGATIRIDCLVELPDSVYVIIELKLNQNPKTLSQTARNSVLAALVQRKVSKNVIDEELAMSVVFMERYNIQINNAFNLNAGNILTEHDRTRIIADTIRLLAPIKEVNAILAKVAEKNIPSDEIEAVLSRASTGTDLGAEEVDERLTQSAKNALSDIIDRGYHKMIADEAKDIIDLGLAVYDHGKTVKALFGPKLKPKELGASK